MTFLDWVELGKFGIANSIHTLGVSSLDVMHNLLFCTLCMFSVEEQSPAEQTRSVEI